MNTLIKISALVFLLLIQLALLGIASDLKDIHRDLVHLVLLVKDK